MELHQRKLHNIRVEKPIIQTSADDLLMRINMNKYRAHEFNNMEREMQINFRNRKLLQKLTEISQGKWSSVSTYGEKGSGSPKNAARKYKIFRPNPKSLNYLLRKAETDRIERENVAFAKRLLEKPACMSKKTLDSDYSQYIKYRQQIVKVKDRKSLQQIRRGGYLLPPLDRSVDYSRSAPGKRAPRNESEPPSKRHTEKKRPKGQSEAVSPDKKVSQEDDKKDDKKDEKKEDQKEEQKKNENKDEKKDEKNDEKKDEKKEVSTEVKDEDKKEGNESKNIVEAADKEEKKA